MQQNNQQNNPIYYIPPQQNPSANLHFEQDIMVKQAKRKEKKEIISAGFAIGITTIVYLVMQLITVSFLQIGNIREIYDNSATVQNLFNVIAVHICSMLIPFGLMALIMRKRFSTKVVPTEKVGVLPFWAWVSTGMGFCFLANLLASFVMNLFKELGHEMTVPEYLPPSNTMDCIALIVSTAIIPAIIEELSLRCFSMGILRKYGKGFAVFVVSCVFGMLHGNVVQFIFATSVGLIMGYITVRTDSVIPAMLVHGFNNGLSVTQDIVKYAAGKSTANIVISVIYIAWLIAAVVGIIYLLATKRLFPKRNKDPKPPEHIGFFKKLLYFLPGMIVPIAIFSALIITSTFPEIISTK